MLIFYYVQLLTFCFVSPLCRCSCARNICLYYLSRVGGDGDFSKPGSKNVSGVEHQEIYANLVAVWKQDSKSFLP